MSDKQPAVVVKDLYKSFKLPHEQHSGIKQIVLNFTKKKKGYEVQHVLDGMSFEIRKGEFFGIVGRNGSGKSTLLKLLAGIYVPDKGLVQVEGSLTPFIELGVGFNPELTGRENVFMNGALLGFGRPEMETMYDDIVEFAELERFMDQKLKNYSSGMQVRLAFSIAIRAKSDILLIDEVLAVGDSNFQRKCYDMFDLIKKSGRTVILVTHDMSVVQKYCDRAVMVKSGRVAVEGAPRKVALEYELENLEYESNEATADNMSDAARKRPKNPPVQVDNIIIGGNSKKRGYSLTDKIEVTLELTANKDSEIAAGINLTRTDGVYVAGIGTKYDGVIKLKKGTHRLNFTIAPGQLAVGDYNVNGAVFAFESFELMDFMDSSVGIKTPVIHVIEASRINDGLFNIRGNWEVK